jgi:RHS repeat-associated protein
MGAVRRSPEVKFTGKERDAETGLDYFGARYFSGAQGRFTSPDLPLIDQGNAGQTERFPGLAVRPDNGRYLRRTTLASESIPICPPFLLIGSQHLREWR